MESNDFPSNSKTSKPEVRAEQPEKKVEPIIAGTARKRKKGLGAKFKETMLAGADSQSVFEYIVFDIMIPAGKDLFLDAMNAGFERKFYGEVRSAGRRGYGRPAPSSGYTSYRGVSSHPALAGAGGRQPAAARRPRNFDMGEIIIDTRVEATDVLDQMYELLSRYEVVTVADLYDMVRIETNYTDNRFGWTDLRGADIQRVRDGYVIQLPRPIPLD